MKHKFNTDKKGSACLRCGLSGWGAIKNECRATVADCTKESKKLSCSHWQSEYDYEDCSYCIMQASERLAAEKVKEERDTLQIRVNRLEAAIRTHKDQKADDRCWIDDSVLYSVLGEGFADTKLPSRDVFLANCARYHAFRQNPSHKYEADSEQIRALKEEIRYLKLTNPCPACQGTGKILEDHDGRVGYRPCTRC